MKLNRPLNIIRLCGPLNPDIRIFFLLFFARVVALLGYLFRSVLGFHRDELYNFTVLGVNALLLAGAFSLLYFAWLIYSELGTLGRLFSSEEAVCDIIFNGKSVFSFNRLRLIILADIVFFSAFYLTTLKLESDLFVFYLLPILTASIYVRRAFYRRIFIAGACIALVLTEFVVYLTTHGQFDSRPDTFTGLTGIKRLLINVMLIRVVALIGAAFFSSSLVSTFRESRSLLNSYLDNIPVALWRKLKDGTFIFVNRNMVNLTNKPYHKIIGYTDADLYEGYAQRFQDGDAQVINMN